MIKKDFNIFYVIFVFYKEVCIFNMKIDFCKLKMMIWFVVVNFLICYIIFVDLLFKIGF